MRDYADIIWAFVFAVVILVSFGLMDYNTVPSLLAWIGAGLGAFFLSWGFIWIISGDY